MIDDLSGSKRGKNDHTEEMAGPPIPYLSLRKVTAQHQTEIEAAVKQVIESGWYLQGEATRRFETLRQRARCPDAHLPSLQRIGTVEGRRRGHRSGQYLHCVCPFYHGEQAQTHIG